MHDFTLKMSRVAHNFQDKTRTGDVIISESVDFNNLLLSDSVLNGLKNAGFVRPSPIQLKAIPLGRCGLDLIVQAKSGTGKTCVFSVIALESIVNDTASTQVLVLAPTREIAVQIWEVINSIGSAVNGLQCHTFIGGMPLHEDRIKLKKCHIAVGSPGRIKQLIEGGVLRTESIRLFVLDEADKLLEESFQEQINWIYSTLPENKQMLALSATYPEYLADHLTAYMRNPTFLRLNISDPALLGIRQYYQTVAYHPMSHVVFEEKTKVLSHILSSISFQQCLVFSNLQTRAQTLAAVLTKAGWPTSCIAGCLDQTERNNAMAQLKTYKCRVLISTDLTARGIDADKVNLVINMDIPKDHETYLHRIGRAGRFGSFGIAITIISEGQERLNMNSVEKRCNTQIHGLPDPIPSDLARPDCPVFLDDVVSSEIINTDQKRHNLPTSPRKIEIQNDSKDKKKQEEIESTENCCKSETFPYVLRHEGDAESVKSNEQTNVVAENDTVNCKKICKSDVSIDINDRSDFSFNVNNSHVSDKNDTYKTDVLSSEIDLIQELPCTPCMKSNSLDNSDSDRVGDSKVLFCELTDYMPPFVENHDEEKVIQNEHKKEHVESPAVPNIFMKSSSKCSNKYNKNSAVNLESNVSFPSLEDLDITDVIQHNIGYKTLSKCGTYKSARESLIDFQNRKPNVPDNEGERYSKLLTYCSVFKPNEAHSDTETLRRAISQLQNIHECSPSSLLISVADDLGSSSGMGVSAGVDDQTADTVNTGDIDIDFPNDEIIVQNANTDTRFEKIDINLTDERNQKLEHADQPLLTEVEVVGSNKSTIVGAEENIKQGPKIRRKRFGYSRNFAVGHLLELERDCDHCKLIVENENDAEAGKILTDKVETFTEPTYLESIDLLAQGVETQCMVGDYNGTSEDRPENKNHHTSLSEIEFDNYENLSRHYTENEQALHDTSESEFVSSSDISDSDSESYSESSEEEHHGYIHEGGANVRQRDVYESDSQSRSVRSNGSDSKTNDSGVYSRPSYQDYWRQWYNDWFTYSMSHQLRSDQTNQSGCYGYQHGYPSNYCNQTPYSDYHHHAAYFSQGMHPYSGPSYQQWYPYGDFRPNLYPATQHYNSGHWRVNSPEPMQDAFRFQSEYIKQMSTFDYSRKSKEN